MIQYSLWQFFWDGVQGSPSLFSGCLFEVTRHMVSGMSGRAKEEELRPGLETA